MTAEMIYERRWALTVVEQVLNRLKGEYATAGNAALFDSLKQLLPGEPGSPSQAEIAARLGMSENAVRQAFYRFRQRYRNLRGEHRLYWHSLVYGGPSFDIFVEQNGKQLWMIQTGPGSPVFEGT